MNSTSRKELKKFRKFVLKNRWWLCNRSYCVPYTYRDIYNGEVYRDLCNKCRLIEMIDYTYKDNTKSDLHNFSNCHLSLDFYDLYYNYYKRWGNKKEESKCTLL